MKQSLRLLGLPGRAFPTKLELVAFEMRLQIGIAFDQLYEATQCAIEGILHAVGIFGVALGGDVEDKRNVEPVVPVAGDVVWHAVLADISLMVAKKNGACDAG